MSIPASLAETRIAILGLGLMGGSLALALRGHCRALFGADPDPEAVNLARRDRVVDAASTQAGEILPEADLVILAAPVRAIIATIEQLPELHPGSPMVMDLGSTKRSICQALAELPARFDPIGGHPMCGKETPGLVYADPSIFQGAAFILTSLERTSPQAQYLAEHIVRAIKSRPVWLDAHTHDRWVAATSHLPYVLSVSLALATPGEAAPLVGPGFRGVSRLAASSAAMMSDALSTNGDNLLLALAHLRAELDGIENILREGDASALDGLLHSAAAARARLIGDMPTGGTR